MTSPSGADPELVGPWLAAQTGDEAWRSCSVELISGGKSNLTYAVDSAAGEYVLRRPPTGHILPTAHDMLREARVIGALGPVGFPVPALLAIEATGDLLGQPFYVMERVHGHIIRGELPAGYAATNSERATIAERLVATLADLHAVDYQAAGLSEFGRPDGYMERQVRRWGKQSAASGTTLVPALDVLAADLTASVPVHSDTSVVHGDYRLDNCVLDPLDVGRVAAVLDWEMSTLGDPLADVGLLLVYWASSTPQQAALSGLTPTVTGEPGFPTRESVASAYAAASGRDLSELYFYCAFGYFKLAVVVQGIIARLAAGAMGGQDFGDMDELVPALVERGRACLSDHSLG